MTATYLTIDPATQDVVLYLNEGVPGSATLDGTETLTNKTLTTPKIGTAILDTNGNELLKLTATASAVNELTLANAATGGTPTLTASGDDTNIDINLVPKGSGTVKVSGVTVASPIGLQTIWIPAAAMVSRTTNGAASGTVEMTTNKNMFKTLDFDTATSEFAQFAIQMPKSWNEGTVTAAFVWSHAATTTNFGVAFGLQGVAVSNDDAGDVAFGTGVLAVDTGGTTNDIYVSPTTAAITIAGSPAAQDYVMFQVYRAVSDGGDTMAIDARLHGRSGFAGLNAVGHAMCPGVIKRMQTEVPHLCEFAANLVVGRCRRLGALGSLLDVVVHDRCPHSEARLVERPREGGLDLGLYRLHGVCAPPRRCLELGHILDGVQVLPACARAFALAARPTCKQSTHQSSPCMRAAAMAALASSIVALTVVCVATSCLPCAHKRGRIRT